MGKRFILRKQLWKGGKQLTTLISGQSGFIGKNLTERLEALGHRVIGIPRILLNHWYELSKFMEKHNPNFIFHLASYGNHSTQQDEEEIINTNILGTFNMLTASKNIKYKKFINFSTSSVLLPYETFYSASKAAGERIVKAFVYKYDKPILTIRPYSIYGKGEADFRFIPTVIKSLLGKNLMRLDPLARHDWVYIEDFITSLLSFIETEVGIINMGTGKSTSNMDIVKLLERISNKTLKYEVGRLREFDISKWVSPEASITSDLEKGLMKTYEYYKQRFKA